MYAQAALKPNTLLRNGAYGIVMRGVQKMHTGVFIVKGQKKAAVTVIKGLAVRDTEVSEYRKRHDFTS